MSHFAVLAITPGEPTEGEIAHMLDPYWEGYWIEEEEPPANGIEPKWDWFSIGGRWEGSLLLKDGSWANSAPIAALETEQTDAMREELEHEWEELVSEDTQSVFKPEYYRNRYGDAEGYVRANRPNTFRAIVTTDGGWEEVGEMGWFGIAYEKANDWDAWTKHYWERMATYAEQGMWATVVDCHI